MNETNMLILTTTAQTVINSLTIKILKQMKKVLIFFLLFARLLLVNQIFYRTWLLHIFEMYCFFKDGVPFYGGSIAMYV